MVVAGVLNFCCSRVNCYSKLPDCDLCCCCTGKCCAWVDERFPEPSEATVAYRKAKWNLWLNSVADDLDLVADWLFFEAVFTNRGGFDGGATRDAETIALFVFTILGSITWLLELWDVTVRQPQGKPWKWLSYSVILLEDVPQIIMTLIINDAFDNLSGRAGFNVTTSLYGIFIKISSGMFLNCNFCYCNEPDDLEEQQEKDR